jgi:O-antigen ligase
MKILKQGIYLIIFCLPLYLIRFEIFKIPTTALELLIYALFVLWVIKGGHKGLWAVLKHERLLVWGTLLLLLGVSIATIFSWDIRISAGIWKAWFVDALLFLFVFVTVIKKEDVKKVFNSLIFSGLVVAIISLVYLICGDLNYQGRLQGIFNSPNYLAMYLAPMLIILMANIYSHKDTCRSRNSGSHSISADCGRLPMRSLSRTNICLFLCLVSCILFLVVLFFTKSFGVLLGTISAIGLGAIIYFYQKNKKILAMGLIIIGFAIILVFGLIKIQSIEGLKSFDARFAIWDKAINAFLENPFTGIGPGTFELYFPPFPKWGVPQPHNIFLAFLIQTGLVGFVGFILILIWFYKNNTKNLVLLCLMTYILAHGLVDTTYWKNDLSLMFWMIIGTTLILQFYRVKSAIDFVDKE